MAFIEKRRRKQKDGTHGPARWRVRYEVRDEHGRVHERSRTFDREDDARRFRRRVEGDLDAGTYIDARRSRDSLGAWVPEWRASVVDLRPGSLSRLDATVNTHVLPRFGEVPLAGITNADVRAWVAELRSRGQWRVRWTEDGGDRQSMHRSEQLARRKAKAVGGCVEPAGLAPSSVRKAAFALRRILEAAVADRRLTANPADNVPLPAEDQGGQRFLSPTEVATLADAIAERFAALVLVACYGGLRFGEMAALRRRRVDLLRGRLEVAETLVDVGKGQPTFGPPKTKKGRRTVPIPRTLVTALEEHLGRYVDPSPDALVFTNEHGLPLRRGTFRRDVWLPAVTAAGLEGLRPHDCRHTYVSLCAAAGLDLYEVSVRAGHSSAAFTADRYRHLFDDAADTYADALDKLLEGAKAASTASVRALGR